MTFLRFPINIRRRNFGLKKNDEVKTIEPEALVILKWKKRVEREREREITNLQEDVYSWISLT